MFKTRRFLAVVGATVLLVSGMTASSSVLAGSISQGGVSRQASSPTTSWKLEFATSLSPEVAAGLVQSVPAQLIMLAFEQEANAVTWVGEVNVAQSKSPAEVGGAFVALRLDTIAHQLTQSAEVIALHGPEPSLVNVRSSLEKIAREVRGAHITGATAVADEPSIRRLAADSRIREIRLLRPITAPPPARTSRTSAGKVGLASPLGSVGSANAAILRSQWVPDDVYQTIAPQDSDRYSQQYIWWAGDRTLGWCYRCGYEAIMFEYNYENIQYLNADFVPGSEIPIVVTWSSSLPGAYLHTRWSDANACPGCYKVEVGHSIGTNGWNWGQIYAGNFYNTYIRVRAGNSSTGKAKQAPTLTECQAGGARCDTWEMYHTDQCMYNRYNDPSSFWPVRGLPVYSWHWNRTVGSDNGLQPAC